MFFHTAAKISIENTSVILKPLKRGKKGHVYTWRSAWYVFESLFLVLKERRDELKCASEFCAPCRQIVFNVDFMKKSSFRTGNVINVTCWNRICPSPLLALPGNLPMVLHLLIGSPLTQAGLWMETRMLIRPSSLLHHRQSQAMYPACLSTNTACQNNNNN